MIVGVYVCLCVGVPVVALGLSCVSYVIESVFGPKLWTCQDTKAQPRPQNDCMGQGNNIYSSHLWLSLINFKRSRLTVQFAWKECILQTSLRFARIRTYLQMNFHIRTSLYVFGLGLK